LVRQEIISVNNCKKAYKNIDILQFACEYNVSFILFVVILQLIGCDLQFTSGVIIR